MRTTRKQVENVCRQFCRAINKPIAKDYNDKGAYALEYIACYGGYSIVEYLESGGEGQPFGSRRRSPSEMFDVLHFAMRAIALAEDPEGASSFYWPKRDYEESAKGAA